MHKKRNCIILDDPIERYIEIDTSYYKKAKISSYRRNKGRQTIYRDLDDPRKEYRFGDLLLLYGRSINVVYLFDSGRFHYVYATGLDNKQEIERITDSDISRCVGSLNELSKNRVIASIRNMESEDRGIPDKSKEGLSKLMNR